MDSSTQRSALPSRLRRYYKDLAPLLKKPKMRASTTAVFSFLAVSLFLWYAVRPTAQTIIYLQREIKDKTTLNKQMEAKITALIEAQATYETIASRLPLLVDALPRSPDPAILAVELRNIANVSQASISAMQIAGVPLTTKDATPGAKLIARQPLQDFTISLVISGPYTAIKAFLDGLITLRRITTIDMVSIRQGVTLNSSDTALQLSIRLKSYYTLQ